MQSLLLHIIKGCGVQGPEEPIEEFAGRMNDKNGCCLKGSHR